MSTNSNIITNLNIHASEAFLRLPDFPASTPPTPEFCAAVPNELKALRQWVLWKLEERDGRMTKVPYQPTDHHADPTAPRTWNTFDVCVRALQTGRFSGIGFVFAKGAAAYGGVDLDKCRDPQTGVTEPWAAQIIKELGSYSELSQSKTGWHIIVKNCELPVDGGRHKRVEMYCCGRYFCMTGDRAVGCTEIRSASLANLYQRMVEDKLDPSVAEDIHGRPINGRDTSPSGEDYKIIGSLARELQTEDPTVIESEIARRYPERYRSQNEKHGDRKGGSYWHYSIGRFVERQRQQAGTESSCPREAREKHAAETYVEPGTSPTEPSPQNTSTESQDADDSPSPSENQYPIEVWNGTLFQECADLCRSNNHLPPEFFIESLKTVIGAICGHRIVQVNNIGQESRFYTTIMSEHTGDGKSETAKWMMDMMISTGLLYDSERPPLELKNIGAYRDTFASGRGMVEAFFIHPRILQWYDELSIMVEKFGIVGSGASFMGLQTDMFESKLPPRSRIGGTKPRPVDAPPTCHNSVLACTVKKKRDVMYASSGAENSGWFPRENLIVTGEVELVAVLHVPDLTEMGEKLKRKIMPLEYRRAKVFYSIAAQQMIDDWFLDLRQRTKEESDDVSGRLNVLAQRNAAILAWLLTDCEHEDFFGETDAEFSYSSEDVRIEVTEDIVRRAILLAEYTLGVRRDNQPLVADNGWAKCENVIKKHLCQVTRTQRKVLYRRANLSRFGIKMVNQSLLNLIQDKTICIRNKPDREINGHLVPMSDEEALKLPDSVFQWMGDGRTKDKGWTETRGGDRKSPYCHPSEPKN